ncbi:hypothetical protein Clacol_002803 [Clathrus columnatus]|uniref:Uncharacterized protein n=1 Tax=Clathrus columnatus TaxID=1419009 RepID=A0AAV5A5S0_9AGAM|nr:hypothetical protein Clacol_002803 [Clathrus columnatus]
MQRSFSRSVRYFTRQSQNCLLRNYATSVEEWKSQEKDPQLGDYPQLPWVTNQVRPARGWWDLQMRRNYGEVIHEEDDALNMWSPDPPVIEPSSAVRQFAVAFLGIAGLGFWIYKNVPDRVAAPREYPYDGLIKELGGLEENKANPEQLDNE